MILVLCYQSRHEILTNNKSVIRNFFDEASLLSLLHVEVEGIYAIRRKDYGNCDEGPN